MIEGGPVFLAPLRHYRNINPSCGVNDLPSSLLSLSLFGSAAPGKPLPLLGLSLLTCPEELLLQGSREALMTE